MVDIVCQAVLAASVKGLSWPSGEQSSDMDVETLGSAKGEQSELIEWMD